MIENYKISVLMPSFNCEKFVEEAINSVINQTYSNFELIIIDGGSTDNTISIIKSFLDPRIKLFKHPEGLNLINSLNFGLKKCKGDFIARMDADDISIKTRFFQQLKYLIKNPSVGLLGTRALIINNQGQMKNKSFNLYKSSEIEWALHFDNQFFHSSIMIRKSILDKFKLKYGLSINYRKNIYKKKENYDEAEDYLFWIVLNNFCTAANLREPLILHRIHSNSKSQLNKVALNQSYINCCQTKISITMNRFVDHETISLFLLEKKSLDFHYYNYMRLILRLKNNFLKNKKHNHDLSRFLDRDVLSKILNFKYYKQSILFKILPYFYFIYKFGLPNSRYELKNDIKFLFKKAYYSYFKK